MAEIDTYLSDGDLMAFGLSVSEMGLNLLVDTSLSSPEDTSPIHRAVVVNYDELNAIFDDARHRVDNDIRVMRILGFYGIASPIETEEGESDYKASISTAHFLSHPSTQSAPTPLEAAKKALGAYLQRPEYVAEASRSPQLEEIFPS